MDWRRYSLMLVLVCIVLMLVVSSEGQGQSKPSERKTGDTATFDLPGSATIEMVWIEPGTFTMGTTKEQEQLLRSKGMWTYWFAEEYPAHEVTISHGFWFGKYEITQEQWESVMGTQPWSGQSYVLENPNHPAVYITWNHMQKFISKLNQAEETEVVSVNWCKND